MATHCDVENGDPATYDMSVLTTEIDTCRMMSGALSLLATKRDGEQDSPHDAVRISIPGYAGPGRYEITGEGNVGVTGTIARGDKELVARGCGGSQCVVTVSRPDAATPEKHRFEVRCAKLCESGWDRSRCTTQADGFSFDAEAVCQAP